MDNWYIICGTSMFIAVLISELGDLWRAHPDKNYTDPDTFKAFGIAILAGMFFLVVISYVFYMIANPREDA